MRRVRLTDGYYIEADGRDYMLYREETAHDKKGNVKYDKDGNEEKVCKCIGYYSCILNCLKRYLEFVGNNTTPEECASIDEYIETFEKAVNETAEKLDVMIHDANM